MGKIYWIILIVVAIAVVITVVWLAMVLSPEGVPVEREVIKIGMVGPLTGGAAVYGIGVRDGIQLAIAELNERQDLYRYELVTKDDQLDSSLAEEAARELAADSGVMAVIGAVTSNATLAAGRVFQDIGLPAISPSATSPEISELGDFIFRICPSDTFQGKSAAEFVVQDLGFHQIAIFWDEENAAYSGGLANAFSQRAEELAAVITKRLSYRAGQKEFTSLLEQLKATNPEALYVPGYYTEAALIAQQARLMDWTIPVIGGDGFHSSELIEAGGRAVDGVKLTSFFISTDPRLEVQDFVQAYERRFGTEPGWLAAHGYDAMNVIARAIEMRGASREGVQQGLSQIEDFKGVTGMITFDEKGDVLKDILKLEVEEGRFRVWGL